MRYVIPKTLFVILATSTIDAFKPSSITPLRELRYKSKVAKLNFELFATVEKVPLIANADVVTKKADGKFVPMPTVTTTVAAVPKLAQRWRKSTKQLATLGPASSTKEMIEKLFLAGADVFRLNFSHGSQEQKKELLIMIREIEEKYSHPIAILGDLQGPKLRVRAIILKQNLFVSYLFLALIFFSFNPLSYIQGWRVFQPERRIS